MALVPVKDRPGLYRDTRTNSIVNIDDKAYQNYQKKKKLAHIKQDFDKAKEERINNLETEVKDLHVKLNKILDILTNGNS